MPGTATSPATNGETNPHHTADQSLWHTTTDLRHNLISGDVSDGLIVGVVLLRPPLLQRRRLSALRTPRQLAPIRCNFPLLHNLHA